MIARSPPSDQLFSQLDHIASPIFVLEADAQGVPRYVAFNSYARSLSARPLSDYLGRTAEDVYQGAAGLTAYRRHCEVLRTREAMTYELDLPINGTVRAIRTTLQPEICDNGACRLYGTSVDLTDTRTTSEAQMNFDTLTSEMEQFVAMAAHDLRAPMRNIGMIADMLRDGFVDRGDGKLELIDMMEEVSSKTMILISDVLAHAHAVDILHSEVKFNFAALCRDLCDVLDPCGQHRLTYTQAYIFADRTAYQIGIRNLIDNAIKHGNREQMHIDITVQRGEGNMLDVILSDNGEGFSAAALKFINGGAFRVDSGYGLLGVRRMVQARGGTMSASNAEFGQGAVIRLSLPGRWLSATNSLGDPVESWRPQHGHARSKIA